MVLFHRGDQQPAIDHFELSGHEQVGGELFGQELSDRGHVALAVDEIQQREPRLFHLDGFSRHTFGELFHTILIFRGSQ